MDFAYDHIAERTYSGDRSDTPKPPNADEADVSASHTPKSSQPQRPNLQDEFQETFKAFSNSQWGVKLGGWWSSASKQAESYYETARKEAEKREAEASKALEEVRKTVVERTKTVIEATEDQLDNLVNEDKKAEQQKLRQEQQQQQEAESAVDSSKEAVDTTLEDNETFINRFRSEAAKRLKEVQKAEDAADEALLRFGMNVRNFLRDAVSITAPEPSTTTRASEVLFESKDATTGKRVIHTSRFDAQLHVIHTSLSSFTQDPDSTGSEGQWEEFKKNFDIDQKTDAIAKDLDTYQELRVAMEKLVPEKVEYKDFWIRYYFLRHVVEMQESRRREMLKASTSNQPEEEVAWDEDSESEDKATSSSPATKQPQIKEPPTSQPSSLQPPSTKEVDTDAMTLKPSRRSHDEKSVADSDASYDLVSGAPSHTAGSPKEKPSAASGAGDESDEDWE